MDQRKKATLDGILEFHINLAGIGGGGQEAPITHKLIVQRRFRTFSLHHIRLSSKSKLPKITTYRHCIRLPAASISQSFRGCLNPKSHDLPKSEQSQWYEIDSFFFEARANMSACIGWYFTPWDFFRFICLITALTFIPLFHRCYILSNCFSG